MQSSHHSSPNYLSGENKVHTRWHNSFVYNVYCYLRSGQWHGPYEPLEVQKTNELDQSDDAENLEVLNQMEQGSLSSKSKLSHAEIAARFYAMIFSAENMPNISKAGLLTLLNMGFSFSTPYLFNAIMDMLSKQDKSSPDALEKMYFSIALIAYGVSNSPLITNARDKILASVQHQSIQRTIYRLSKHLMEQPLEYHRSTEDSEKDNLFQKGFDLSSTITPMLTKILPTLLEISISSIVLAYRFGAGLSLGLMGVVLFQIAHSQMTAKNIIQVNQEIQDIAPKTWHALTNCLKLAVYKTIYDFNKLSVTLENIDHSTRASSIIFIKANCTMLDIVRTQIVIVYGGLFGILLLMGNRVLNHTNDFSAADFGILFMYLTQLCRLLPELGNAVSNIFATLPTLELIFNELEETAYDIDSHKKFSALPAPAQDIPIVEFNQVALRYPRKDQNLFSNISFKIYPGQTVALVSKSGAGKSSIFDMLYRYYEPSSGAIYINGQQINQTQHLAVQETIALARQQAPLVGNTIREVLSFASNHHEIVTDENLWALAKKLKLVDFIQGFSSEFPRSSSEELSSFSLEQQKHYFHQGLSADIGVNGSKLSGGEQQKIAIMRAMLKPASIRLLDECTSALDAPVSKAILQGINAIAIEEKSTQIIISHKLQETQHSDLILVLDKETGTIAAQGTHDQLLDDFQGCDIYKELWLEQNQTNQRSLSSSPHASLFGDNRSATTDYDAAVIFDPNSPNF